MKKYLYQLITLIALAIAVISCGDGSSGSNGSGPTTIGTLPNGSSIIISQSNFSITSSSGTTGTIRITSESSPYTGTVTFSISPTNGPTITTTPSPCVLNSATPARVCTLTINGNNAANGIYTVTPTITDNSTGTAQVLSTFTITVATPTPSPSPTYTPAPPVPFTPSSQFGVYNNCSYPIWVQSYNTPSGDQAIIPLSSKQGYSYHINGQYVGAFRAWAKVGCDSTGNNCAIGQELQPCPSAGCQPAVDSLAEGTFNAPEGNHTSTFIDISAVNGFTLPYALQIVKSSTENNPACVSADASGLDYNNCPTSEDVSTPASQMTGFGSYAFGPYSSYNSANLTSVNLKVINPQTGETVGCAAPSTQLTDSTWGGIGVTGTNPSYINQVIMYSCAFTSSQLLNNNAGLPSSSDYSGFTQLSNFCNNTTGYCNAQDPNGPAASKICKLGPVVNTQYVQYVHSHSTDVYAYAYDDGTGTRVCNSTRSKATFVLCP